MKSLFTKNQLKVKETKFEGFLQNSLGNLYAIRGGGDENPPPQEPDPDKLPPPPPPPPEG